MSLCVAVAFDLLGPRIISSLHMIRSMSSVSRAERKFLGFFYSYSHLRHASII